MNFAFTEQRTTIYRTSTPSSLQPSFYHLLSQWELFRVQIWISHSISQRVAVSEHLPYHVINIETGHRGQGRTFC